MRFASSFWLWGACSFISSLRAAFTTVPCGLQSAARGCLMMLAQPHQVPWHPAVPAPSAAAAPRSPRPSVRPHTTSTEAEVAASQGKLQQPAAPPQQPTQAPSHHPKPLQASTLTQVEEPQQLWASATSRHLEILSSVSRGRAQFSGDTIRIGPFTEGAITEEGGDKGDTATAGGWLLEQWLWLGLGKWQRQRLSLPLLYQLVSVAMSPKLCNLVAFSSPLSHNTCPASSHVSTKKASLCIRSHAILFTTNEHGV